MPSTYRVAVGAFEGPFDLLLQLIARHKVDIWEISIAQITDDYLAVLREMESSGVDLDVTTEFLVVAATLLELKAARLLPGEDDPELEELALEARDLLYARLLDYRTFKEAAGFLARQLAVNDGFVPRAVPVEERYATLRPEVDLRIDAAGLAELAARALAERPDPVVDLSHVQPVRLTVREAAGMVMDELTRAGGRVTFAELAAGCRHRIEVIVHFLALLELFKHGHVDLSQTASFASIVVTVDDDSSWQGSAFAAMDAYEGRPASEDAPDTAEAASPAETDGS